MFNPFLLPIADLARDRAFALVPTRKLAIAHRPTPHSYLNATIGSTFVALRAGT
jgi:hypothetical protein